MSRTAAGLRLPAAALADERGRRLSFDAPVTDACFDRSGRRAALALGDGTIRLLDPGDEAGPVAVPAHPEGVGLALCPGGGDGFLSGGDDGRLVRVAAAGEAVELAVFEGAWIDRVASASGLYACSVGRRVRVWTDDGVPAGELDHPSTAGGLAFDAKGRRLAVAHYGGATYWLRDRKGWLPKRLEWPGSHTDVAWSPDGRFVVTAMQENALHGWRLSDGAHMRMDGYPGKIRGMAWTADGRFLATTGADRAVCWPFRGADGPMGKTPLEVGFGGRQLSTAIAAHPRLRHVAIGFRDGLVLLAPVEEGARAAVVKAPGPGAVAALAFAPDGGHLVVGDTMGEVVIVAMPIG